jgi:hypothetical protein
MLKRYTDGYTILPRNLRSLLGKKISVETSYRQLSLGSSRVTECDMVGTNGVVHALGGVIQEKADPFKLFDFLWN